MTTMSELSDFDNDLCDYILGQIRPHLRSSTVKSNRPSKLDYDRFHQLDLPEWLGRVVTALPTSLAKHIWAGVHGEPVVQSLNDSELNSLIIALADPPLRCEEEAVWMPYPALHRRATLCLPAISAKFTRQTAEEWARDCHTFSTALERDDLPLASGVEIVQDWLRLIRQFQDLMGKSSAITSSRSVEKQVLHPAENRQQPEMLTPSLVARAYFTTVS